MAQYDRRILVPYLRDVCAAEMACEKIAEKEMDSLRSIHSFQMREQMALTEMEQIQEPPMPEKDIPFYISKKSRKIWLAVFAAMIPLGLVGIEAANAYFSAATYLRSE